MKQALRVIGCALLTSHTLAALVILALTSMSEVRPKPAELVWLVTTISPASLPMAVLGGWIAYVVLRRDRGERSLRTWIGRGCAWGSGLGVLGVTLWFAVDGTLKLADPWAGHWLTLQQVTLIGAPAGIAVGSIVATYCWRLSRVAPPATIAA